MGRGRWITGVLALSLAIAGPAAAQYGPPGGGGGGGSQPDASVNAEGNVFLGGLAFDPADVRVKVGETVRWTNTDFLVPHTATENNGLWRLSGSYGGTPFNPPGFGPGESRERVFEAGTHSYYCEVHPGDMSGVVRVPVTVRRRPGGRTRVTWATDHPDAGQAFDVQRREDGRWKFVRKGTTEERGRFARGGKFRARLRLADDRDVATGWSPPARP